MAGKHERSRARRTVVQRLAIALGVILVVSCIAAASAVSFVYWKTGRFQRAHVNLDPVSSAQAPRNYLIIGSDSRANIDPTDPNAQAFLGAGEPTGQRSDTILLVRVDPQAGDVKMLSFPRDLWVPIAGQSYTAKINSAYGVSKQTLIDTIRNNFGVTINNYIEVDFKGFQELVNAIGGVNMYFPTALQDTHIGLDIPNPGCVNLKGEQGLAYARSRYTQYKTKSGAWSVPDPTSDFGRIKRQQLFVRKAMKKVATLNITDATTFYQLLDVATHSVTIDQTIDRGDLLSLARKFASFTDDQIKSYNLTVTTGTSPDGQSIVLWNKKASQSALNIFRGIDPSTVAEGDITVDVRNGSGVKNQGRDVLAAVGSVGFDAGSVLADSATVAGSTIRYAPGSEAAADLLERHLSTAATLEPDPSLDPDHLVLTTGKSFTTLTQHAAPASSTTTTTPATLPLVGTAITTAPTTTTTTTTTTTVDPYVPGNPPDGVTC